MHARVRDVAAQAVAADEVAVAGSRLAHRHVGLGGVHAVDRAHEQVAARVGGGLLRGDAAGVDEGLHVGVVAGDLGELAVAQQVGARVADVQHGHPRRVATEPRERGERGAHAGELGLRGDDVGDPLARRDDRLARAARAPRRRRARRSPSPTSSRSRWPRPARRRRARPCRRRRRAARRRRSRSPRCRDARGRRRSARRSAARAPRSPPQLEDGAADLELVARRRAGSVR